MKLLESGTLVSALLLVSSAPREVQSQVTCLEDDFEAGSSKFFLHGCEGDTIPFAFRRYRDTGVISPDGSAYYMTNLDRQLPSCMVTNFFQVPILTTVNMMILGYNGTAGGPYSCSFSITPNYAGADLGGNSHRFTSSKNWQNFTTIALGAGEARARLFCHTITNDAVLAINSIKVLGKTQSDCDVISPPVTETTPYPEETTTPWTTTTPKPDTGNQCSITTTTTSTVTSVTTKTIKFEGNCFAGLPCQKHFEP